MKISYVNEIANFCETVGADIEDVARGMGCSSVLENIGQGSPAEEAFQKLHGYSFWPVLATPLVKEQQRIELSYNQNMGRGGDRPAFNLGPNMSVKVIGLLLSL